MESFTSGRSFSPLLWSMVVSMLAWSIASFSLSTEVEAMVVTTRSSKRIHSKRTTTTTTTGPSRDPNSVLRRLLEGSKHRPKWGSSQQSSYTLPKETTSVNCAERKTSACLDPWRDYEVLRDTNLEDAFLSPFFFESGWDRKLIIANRFVQVFGTLYKAQNDWNRSRKEKPSGVENDDEVSLKASNIDDPAAVRLCEAVASLGPLAVKLGQTLSQRPDIVGRDASNALKRLQTQNIPFEDELAYAILRESLDYWDGPLAANSVGKDGTLDQHKEVKPLFKSLSKEPIASASLGQVYKAQTWEKVDLALKIQRPDALSVLAIDTQCFRIASEFRNTLIDWTEQWNALFANTKDDSGENHTLETGMTEEEVRAMGEDGTVASVIDRVAKDVKREMDYRVEAENSYRFRDSLSFLGFVDTPDVLLATDKILATKFVNGHHLNALKTPQQELALTQMAVEACTASMVLTGFVHADPHEGNLMLRTDDGRIVFLDFGLMSDIDPNIMESFAQGIQALLSEDFSSMTEAFSDTGFITSPIMHRDSIEDLWRVDPNFGLEELAADLEHHMKTTEGGMSRFGALATVLNKKISPNWLVFTPPYVLLLIRTFLTLEGIAAQVDPDFNIYEMSMPWVVRRSLSPSTPKGRKVLRSTILKPDNTIQWERILELMEMQKEAAASKNSNEAAPNAASTQEERTRKRERFAASQQGAMKDAVGTLLGCTEGKALRHVLKDLDTPDLIWKLGSKEGRPIVKMGAEKAISKVFSKKAVSESNPEQYRPVSNECQKQKERQAKHTTQVVRWLFKTHVKKCLSRVKGVVGIARLGLSTIQIALFLLCKKALQGLMVKTNNNNAFRQKSQSAA